MKPKGRTLWQMMKAAAKAQRLTQQIEQLQEEVRELEGATCGYCGSWRTWKDLTDESTQTEQRPLICKKCLSRREIAHESGWDDWPRVERM